MNPNNTLIRSMMGQVIFININSEGFSHEVTKTRPVLFHPGKQRPCVARHFHGSPRAYLPAEDGAPHGVDGMTLRRLAHVYSST